MRVRLSRDVIGIDAVYDTDTGAVTRSDTDDVDWHLDASTGLRIDKSINDLAACTGYVLGLTPTRRFVDAYTALGDMPPWVDALPSRELKLFMRSVMTQVDAVLAADRSYHDGTFVPVNRFLSSLAPAHVDRVRLASLAGRGSVDSFCPRDDGQTRPVVYDRFGTRTGRLTVRSGPQILTLAREHRDVLVSRYPAGRVVLLDYVSFEAQVALALAGRGPMADVYASAAHDVFGDALERDVVKRAVLGHLYGMGPASLQQVIGSSVAQTTAVIGRLNGFFTGPEALEDVVARAAAQAGRVVNPFGRVVSLPEGSERLALNTLVQSTAADAALSGFAAVGRHVAAERVEAHPIFVIHDGLLIDCAPSALARLDRLADVAARSTGLVGRFPVRAKGLCD